MSGLGGALATGAALGVGSAVGHAAVGAMMGGGSGGSDSGADNYAQAEAPAQGGGYARGGYEEQYDDPCYDLKSTFDQCLSLNKSGIEECQHYFNLFQQCRDDQSYV